MLTSSSITERLAPLGSDLWQIHFEARRRIALGEDILELTIGEPDLPTPTHLLDVADQAMRSGRTRYSGGRGEDTMLDAVAIKYATRTGRPHTAENVIALPGTQASLAFTILSLAESGDGVLVPDPFYATYEGIVRASSASFVPVPLSSQNGFHLTVDQLESAWQENCKVLLLNSPHNPTGAVLSCSELESIGNFCAKKNIWIVCDEVYESLVYDGEFASLYDIDSFADRTIVASSLSKSHCAPGFRAGWCVGPKNFISAIQPVAEAFLFGGQPFIADMTTHALQNPCDTSQKLGERYRHRIEILKTIFSSCNLLSPLVPQSGMFMLVDVSATGLNGTTFADSIIRQPLCCGYAGFLVRRASLRFHPPLPDG